MASRFQAAAKRRISLNPFKEVSGALGEPTTTTTKPPVAKKKPKQKIEGVPFGNLQDMLRATRKTSGSRLSGYSSKKK
jgi:hypothetical protein